MAENLTVGDYVVKVNCPEAAKEKGKVWKVVKAPWINAQGKEVVFLDDRGGEIGTDKLYRMSV